jgi:hypothetical protein
LRCWWADPGPKVRDRIVAVAQRTGVAASDPRLLATLAVAAPIACAPVVWSRIWDAVPLASVDPVAGHLVGMGAVAVGDYEAALAILTPADEGLRDQGLGLLTQVLGLQCGHRFCLATGRWRRRPKDSRLAQETDQPTWGAAAAMALRPIDARVIGIVNDGPPTHHTGGRP